MFAIFAGISQFERDLISQRTKEGLDSARARGREGGRPSKSKNDIENAIKLYNTKKYSLKDIKKMTGVSKTTLYRYIDATKKIIHNSIPQFRWHNRNFCSLTTNTQTLKFFSSH